MKKIIMIVSGGFLALFVVSFLLERYAFDILWKDKKKLAISKEECAKIEDSQWLDLSKACVVDKAYEQPQSQ